jgi:transcriptional regulator with XRE-family HTH domain
LEALFRHPTQASAAQSADSPLAPLAIERRAPGPRDVQTDIACCGVCQTDLHTVCFECVAGRKEGLRGRHHGAAGLSNDRYLAHIRLFLYKICGMPRTAPKLLPRLSRLLAGLGANIRLARLRRGHSAETVAQRAGITRGTLTRVERGDPAVSLGIYARVLQALRLENDLAAIAADDALGRKLQDAGLEPARRASRARPRPASTGAAGGEPGAAARNRKD